MEKVDLVVAKVLDKFRLFEKTHRLTNTNMLDESEFASVLKCLNGIEYFAFGGYENAERKVIVFGSSNVNFEEFISVIRIESKKNLSHRNVLGSVLGLGIKREMIGDILISDNICDVIVMKDIAKFILQNLERVGKERVTVSEKSLLELLTIKDNSIVMTITVASPRIDAVISACFGFSRELSTECIRREKVLLNHFTDISPSKQVKVNDIISVRGYGRVKIVDFCGETKKARSKIVVRKY